MISPWTIYQQKKQSMKSPFQGKRVKNESFRSNSKSKSHAQKISMQQSELQQQYQTTQLKDNSFSGQLQEISQNEAQNKSQIHILPSTITLQPDQTNCKDSQNFQNKNNLQSSQFTQSNQQYSLTNEQTSRQFLKNVISDQHYDSLDNSKLLDFCRNQSNSEQINLLDRSFSNRRAPLSGHKLIQASKNSLFKDMSSVVLLKFIKAELRKENMVQQQVNDNIQRVLQKLGHEHRQRISPEEHLLDKLLNNEKDKSINYRHESLEAKIKKNKIKENPYQSITEAIQQDNQELSIIKYTTINPSSYLQENTPSKKIKQKQKDLAQSGKKDRKCGQKFNSKERVIYVGKKPNDQRHHNEVVESIKKKLDQKNVSKQKVSSIGQKFDKEKSIEGSDKPQKKYENASQRGQQLIKQLINQHRAQRQSRKVQKNLQTDQDKLRKVQSQQQKVDSIIQINQPTQEKQSLPKISNTKLAKSRQVLQTINPSKHHHPTNKKHSIFADLSSPLIPPQTQLPSLSSLRSVSSKDYSSNLLPSSKLLELITNNILFSKSKSRKNHRNMSLSNEKVILIDKLLGKDKNKKIDQVKNYKKSDLPMNRLTNVNKKTDIKSHKNMVASIDLSGVQQFLSSPQNVYDNKFIMKKDKSNESEDFMSLEKHEPKENPQIDRQLQKMNMGTTQMKFSDHQIISDLNHNKKSKAK